MSADGISEESAATRRQVTIESLRARLAELEAERDRLDALRRGLRMRVADIRLQSLMAGQLSGAAMRSDRRIGELMAQRRQRREETQSLLATRATRRQQRADRLAGRQHEADSARALADRARQAWQVRLSQDADYQVVRTRAEQARADLADLEERRRLACDERDRKSLQYRNDMLFAYLQRRGYGTPTYRAWAATRRIDHWIADLTDYQRARQDYELLQEIPRWLEANIARQRAEAEQADRKLADYLDVEPDRLEVVRLEARARRAERALQDDRRQAEAANAIDHGLEDALAAFEARQDADAQAIRDVYLKVLEGQSPPALMKLAQKTATREDELAVHKLAHAERDLANIADRLLQLQERLDNEHAELARQRGTTDRR